MKQRIRNSSAFTQMEEDLNLFLDGELPLERQPELYTHLSQCDESRSFMDNVMLFRRMSRQEYVSPPPAADDRFFERLALLKDSNERIDREADREPIWNARKPVSVRSAIAAVVGIFLGVLLLPMANPGTATSFLDQEEERVFFDSPGARVMQSYIYVFEPGLTIEADQN